MLTLIDSVSLVVLVYACPLLSKSFFLYNTLTYGPHHRLSCKLDIRIYVRLDKDNDLCHHELYVIYKRLQPVYY